MIENLYSPFVLSSTFILLTLCYRLNNLYAIYGYNSTSHSYKLSEITDRTIDVDEITNVLKTINIVLRYGYLKVTTLWITLIVIGADLVLQIFLPDVRTTLHYGGSKVFWYGMIIIWWFHGLLIGLEPILDLPKTYDDKDKLNKKYKIDKVLTIILILVTVHFLIWVWYGV